MSSSPRLTALLAVALALAGCAGTTPAQKPTAPLPWTAAIGRLDSEREKSSCSASLIAPDLVLTAAHCVIQNQRRFDPATLVFSPNLGDGRRIPDAKGVAFLAVGRYGEASREDWAILRIAPAIDFVPALRVAALSPEELRRALAAGARLGHAGYGVYGLMSGHRLKVSEDCRLRSDLLPMIGEADGVIATSCQVIKGDSGGPILLFDRDGSHRLVGVMSSYWGAQGETFMISYGPSARAFAAKLSAQAVP